MSIEAVSARKRVGSARMAVALGWGVVVLVFGGAATSSSAGDADARQDSAQADPMQADPMLAEMGTAPFERYCTSCHGAKAQGDGPVAPALATAPADLTRIAARRGGEFPRGEIGRMIDGRFRIDAHGTREMPVWGTRFGEAIADPGLSEEVSRGTIAVLVEYLISIQAH
jgi:mono/diheme cytochrome c family protein